MLSISPPSLVANLDLGRPLPKPFVVPESGLYQVLVRLYGRPLGQVFVPAHENEIQVESLVRAIERQLLDRLLQELVVNGLATPGLASLDLQELLRLPAASSPAASPQLSVVICCGHNDEQRAYACLTSLMSSDVPPSEVTFVLWGTGCDAGHWSSLQQQWKSTDFPIRWITLPEADLAAARQAGIAAATTPLVAFLDDSVRVDTGWVAAVVRAFEGYPQAMAVTGPVLPENLQPEPARVRAAVLSRISWAQPFQQKWYRLRPDQILPQTWFNTLQLGYASNMAFRTCVFDDVGGFQPAGDGSASEQSQHLDLWLRLLAGRHGIVLEPAALVWSRPATSMDAVREEIRQTAAGMSASLVAAMSRMPRRFPGLLLMALWFLRTALGDIVRNRGDVRSVSFARLKGHLRGTWEGISGLWKRRDASRSATSANRANHPDTCSPESGRVVPLEISLPSNGVASPAQRQLLNNTAKSAFGEFLVQWHGELLGQASSIVTGDQPVTRTQIIRGVVEDSWHPILTRHLGLVGEPQEFEGFVDQSRSQFARSRAASLLHSHLLPPTSTTHLAISAQPFLPITHSVSIVIPTCDRPADLSECLAALHRQKFLRDVEIIVVDNNPDSGLTGPVIASFPKVRAIAERRRGAAYARNRGLVASRGTIIVSVDDDVFVPAGWLEELVKPFVNPLVGVVTGNVIPCRLQTPEERLSESVCSLSAGPHPILVDGDWFWSHPQPVQGWDFGATANVAIRADMLANSDVGLLMESLGPGTPVGAGEDPYFFYRVVRAGYQLVYLPDVWVWHKHRATKASLRKQVYNYAKSAVAYHLTTLFRDGDRRSRLSLLGGLQKHYLGRFVATLRGRSGLPLWLVLSELSGHVAGTFAFLRSLAREWLISRNPKLPKTPARLLRHAPTNQDADEPWVFSPSGLKTPPRPSGEKPQDPAVFREGTRVIPSVSTSRSPGRLPHFLVIGAQKAGTTALNVNLRKHPLIELVPNFNSFWADGNRNDKETHFFRGMGASHGCPTLEIYQSLFNDNGLLQGEVCPTYDSPESLETIARTIPDAKLILICREPVSRLESAYNHLLQLHEQSPSFAGWKFWKPQRSFEENLENELSSPENFGLLRMGVYVDTINRLLKLFPREQLLFLVAEEYRTNPQATYDRIFDFLGIPRFAVDHEDAHVRHYTTHLTDSQRTWLREFYRPHNQRLFEFLQHEIPAWSKEDRPARGKTPTGTVADPNLTSQLPPSSRVPNTSDFPMMADSQSLRSGMTESHQGGHLPHFLIIDPGKSLTAALRIGLQKHPHLDLATKSNLLSSLGSSISDLHFVDEGGNRTLRSSEAAHTSPVDEDGLRQEESHLTDRGPDALRGIAESHPEAKLILVCAEPVSNFETVLNKQFKVFRKQPHNQSRNIDPRTSFAQKLTKALKSPGDSWLFQRGLYADIIENICRYFPRDQLLVVIAEEFLAQPQAIYDQILDFLGLPRSPIEQQPETLKPANHLTEAQCAQLAELYRPHNRRLFDLLQREIPSWTRSEPTARPAAIMVTAPSVTAGVSQPTARRSWDNTVESDEELEPTGAKGPTRPDNPGRWPHFLVIGAQKSGTTALHYNLRQHPQIEMVPNFRFVWRNGKVNNKETHFFNGQGLQHGCPDAASYRSLFNDNGLIQGESCPNYDAPMALQRIAENIPDVKLILICREPVSRIESAYNHFRQLTQSGAVKSWSFWDADKSFEENVQQELRAPQTPGLLRMGLYSQTIQEVYRHFRRDQLLVLIAEEYQENPQTIYEQIFHFLDLPVVTINHRDAHVREYTTNLTPEQRLWLADFYRPYNRRFFDLIQREVPAWMTSRALRK